MEAKDLRKGSILEIPLNFSPERMNEHTLVKVIRVSKFFIWFEHNHLQRMSIDTIDQMIKYSNYKIIKI